jgi:hypothetical protein
MPKEAKRTTFCTIDQWLEQENGPLKDAITDLCAGHFLKPKRDDSGITFLYPEDKKYQAKIIGAVAEESDGQLEGEQMIRACIIQMYLPDAASFIQNAKDIPNSLGHKVKVIKTSGDSVELDGGVTIVPEKSFSPRKDRPHMAIWRITKGQMPITGEKATYEFGKKKKTGGARAPITDRVAFATFIEDKFRQGVSKGQLAKCDPYLEALLSLLLWIKHLGNKSLLRAILSMIGSDWRTEFYTVFQPYKQGSFLIEDGLFTQWQNETMGYCFVDNPAEVFLKQFECLNSEEKDACATPEGRAKIRAMQDKLRSRLYRAGKELPTELSTVYQTVISSNAYGDVDAIYPQAAASYFASNPDIKYLQEEFRFIVGNAFSDMDSAALSTDEYVKGHEELCKTIRFRLNFNGTKSQCLLFNKDNGLTAAFWYSGPFALTRSTHLIFVGSVEGDETRSLLTTIPDADSNEKVDTVGSEWAVSRMKVKHYARSGRLSAAQLAVEIANKEK